MCLVTMTHTTNKCNNGKASDAEARPKAAKRKRKNAANGAGEGPASSGGAASSKNTGDTVAAKPKAPRKQGRPPKNAGQGARPDVVPPPQPDSEQCDLLPRPSPQQEQVVQQAESRQDARQEVDHLTYSQTAVALVKAVVPQNAFLEAMAKACRTHTSSQILTGKG